MQRCILNHLEILQIYQFFFLSLSLSLSLFDTFSFFSFFSFSFSQFLFLLLSLNVLLYQWDVFDPAEIAKSITFEEFDLFSEIPSVELLTWNRRTSSNCPKISAMISNSTRISTWFLFFFFLFFFCLSFGLIDGCFLF